MSDILTVRLKARSITKVAGQKDNVARESVRLERLYEEPIIPFFMDMEGNSALLFHFDDPAFFDRLELGKEYVLSIRPA